MGALLSSLCAAWFYDANLPLAKLLGALAFSAALTLIVLLGGELFTGCTLVMSVSLYDGRVRLAGTLRVWALAYLGNLLGILVLCLLLVSSGSSGELLGAYLALIVPGKLSAPGICSSSGACCAIFWCASACSLLPPPERDRQGPGDHPGHHHLRPHRTGALHRQHGLFRTPCPAERRRGLGRHGLEPAVGHPGQPAGRRGFAGPPLWYAAEPEKTQSFS
ncbi:formate/nitrite transporter family protein [Flavonifractor plautii]|nr:formate/nitrite transporter family protein [Flavonifractor plautii]